MQRMGKKPFHRRTWHVARGLIVLTTVLALLIAPLVVILTHGPAAHEFAVSMPTMDVQSAAQGHAHSKAGHDHQGGPLGGHSPADHDHQLHALVCQAVNAPKALPDKTQCAFSDVFRHLTPDGPSRPPRAV